MTETGACIPENTGAKVALYCTSNTCTRGCFILLYSPGVQRFLGLTLELRVTDFVERFSGEQTKFLLFLGSEKVFQLQEKRIYPASLTLTHASPKWPFSPLELL